MNAPAQIVKKRNERSEPQNSPSETRVAYPYFHEKRTKNAAGILFTRKDGTPNPRYSGTFMFPKLSSDPHQCANYMFLWGLAVEAARKMWPQNVDQSGQWVWPAGAQFDVKDGDVPFQSKPKPGQPLPNPEEVAKKNAWRRGYWIVEAENFLPDTIIRVAKVVNGQVVDIPAKVMNGVEQYKGGDWGFPCVHAYAYENETFGVNFGFDGFLFTREGERIGNSSGPRSAAQMFASVAGMVANSSMPTGGQAPAAPVANGLPPAPPTAPVAAPMPPQPGYAPPAPPAPVAAPPMAPAAPPLPPGAMAAAPAGLPPLPTR
jgi:hypothetical protein